MHQSVYFERSLSSQRHLKRHHLHHMETKLEMCLTKKKTNEK